MGVNNYHSFEAYDRVISNYDRQRGYNKGFHWLTETAPNNSGGGPKGKTWYLHMPDGSMRAAIWLNVAMGGQGSLFWLWRQHPSGQEMVHGSIINAWNKPVANYDDLKALGQEFNDLSDKVLDQPVAPAKMGLFWSHVNGAGFTTEEYAIGLQYYIDMTYRFYLSFP